MFLKVSIGCDGDEIEGHKVLELKELSPIININS